MSTKRTIGDEPSVEEQAVEQNEIAVEAEASELRPSVEQEIQSTIDYESERRVDGRLFGQTLEAQERLEAREWEIERTRRRFDRRATSDRERRTRQVAEERNSERRRQFGKRAASVDPWSDPDVVDPREQLARDELATVNREAARLAEKLQGWSRAAIGRRLAERIVGGTDVLGAVVGVYEELERAPGQVIPIAAVGEVGRREVSIEGIVCELWVPSNSKIQQVGLIEDETGRTKFTAWKRSDVPMVDEGERVVLREVAKSWYNGRVSVALTGWSQVEFPEREAWWTA